MRDRRGAKKRRAIPKIEAIHERDPPFNSAITLDQKQPGTTEERRGKSANQRGSSTLIAGAL
jgi:hypothetical protein